MNNEKKYKKLKDELFRYIRKTFLYLSILIFIVFITYIVISFFNFQKQQLFVSNIIQDHIRCTIQYLNSYVDSQLCVIKTHEDFNRVSFYLTNNDIFQSVEIDTVVHIKKELKNIFFRKGDNQIIYLIQNNIFVDNKIYRLKCEYNFKELGYLFALLDNIYDFNYYLINNNDNTVVFSDNNPIIGEEFKIDSNLSGYFRVRRNINNNWVLLTTLDVPETQLLLYTEYGLTQFIVPLAAKLLIVLLVMLAISGVFYLILRKNIDKKFKPLAILTKSLEKIATGNFSEPIQIETDDEIGRVVDTFNEVTKKLAHFIDNQRVNTQIAMADAFMIGISHEIISPLRKIQTLIGKLEVSDADKEKVDILKMNIEKVEELLADMQAAQENLKDRAPGGVKIEELLREVLNEFRYEIKCSFVNENPSDFQVMGDKELYRLVFVELVRNAVKSMFDLEEKLLKVVIKPKTSQDVEILVSDSGQGVTRSESVEIFKPFYSGSSSSGMGLFFIRASLGNFQSTVDFVFKEGEIRSSTVKVTLTLW